MEVGRWGLDPAQAAHGVNGFRHSRRGRNGFVMTWSIAARINFQVEPRDDLGYGEWVRRLA